MLHSPYWFPHSNFPKQQWVNLLVVIKILVDAVAYVIKYIYIYIYIYILCLSLSWLCVLYRWGGQVLLPRVWRGLETQLWDDVSRLVLAATQLLVAGGLGLGLDPRMSLWPAPGDQWPSLEVWHERVHQQWRRASVLLWEDAMELVNTGV